MLGKRKGGWPTRGYLHQRLWIKSFFLLTFYHHAYLTGAFFSLNDLLAFPFLFTFCQSAAGGNRQISADHVLFRLPSGKVFSCFPPARCRHSVDRSASRFRLPAGFRSAPHMAFFFLFSFIDLRWKRINPSMRTFVARSIISDMNNLWFFFCLVSFK